jgi:glycosyltransferase involved in cell wall biosynthesis
VGLAPDALDPACIYHHAVDGALLIERDIVHKTLDATVEPHFQRALEHHTPESLSPLFQQLYADIPSVPVYTGIQARDDTGSSPGVLVHRHHTTWKSYLKHQLKTNRLIRTVWRRYARPLLSRGTKKTEASPAATLSNPMLTVCLWHKFVPPPYGGGNQFMMALRSALSARNIRVVENEINQQIDAYVLNSVQFDIDSFLAFQAEQRMAIVHRIDGPISIVGGRSLEEDKLCYEINQKFAAVTVLQSYWTFRQTLDLGFRPVHPVIIHNASDPALFHTRGRVPFDPNRKIRLISTSWSNNPRKGGAVYKWLDQHLDWDRFEYTFVGRSSEQFERIQVVEPVGSAELGEILRQHDIYITASQKDSCSNALIEALSCGLPALYLDDGGNPELVDFGGLAFVNTEETLAQLDKLVEYYDTFQNLITAPKLDDIGMSYLAALQSAVERTRTPIPAKG